MKYIAVIIIKPFAAGHFCFAPADIRRRRTARRDEFFQVWAKLLAAGSANVAQNGAAQANCCLVLRCEAEPCMNYELEARINPMIELKSAAGSPI